MKFAKTLIAASLIAVGLTGCVVTPNGIYGPYSGRSVVYTRPYYYNTYHYPYNYYPYYYRNYYGYYYPRGYYSGYYYRHGYYYGYRNRGYWR